MTDDASTDASQGAPSTEPFPEATGRETDGSTTDRERRPDDRSGTDDGDAATDRRRDAEAGGREDHEEHACGPDSPVPCRFH